MTEKPHEDDRPAASVAVHVTAVVPVENSVPLPGVHVTETGAVPPNAAGVTYATEIGWLESADDSILAGQASVSANVDGGVVGGSPPHAASDTNSNNDAHRVPERRSGDMI